MPVTRENESNHEIVVKNLRKRQISCFIPIIPKKYGNVGTPTIDCPTKSNPASNNSSKDVKRKRTYKKRTPSLPQVIPNTQKRLRFSSTKYKNDFFTPPPTKKRSYGEKNLRLNVTFPRSKQTLSLKTDTTNKASVLCEGIPKKRIYRKKNCMKTEYSTMEQSKEETKSVWITNNQKVLGERMSDPLSESKSMYMDDVAVKVEEETDSTTDTEVSFSLNNDLANDVNSDQIIFLDKIPSELNEEPDLRMDSDTSFRFSNELPAKRVYRNKNLKVPTFTIDLLQKTDTSNPILDGQFGGILTIQLPKKRISHKKILKSTLSSNSKMSLNSSSVGDEPHKKRTYRKRIPTTPHNTPVASQLFQGLDDSTCTSTFSQSSSQDPSFAPPKRGRGRPRLVKRISLPSEEDTSCTLSSLGESDVEGERQLKYDSPPDEPISEYELQRQRNIQENLKVLRQMLHENGFPMDDKSNGTPKIRRHHTRLPLPPPRPKSARIASSEPLDFSRLADFI